MENMDGGSAVAVGSSSSVETMGVREENTSTMRDNQEGVVTSVENSEEGAAGNGSIGDNAEAQCSEDVSECGSKESVGIEEAPKAVNGGEPLSGDESMTDAIAENSISGTVGTSELGSEEYETAEESDKEGGDTLREEDEPSKEDKEESGTEKDDDGEEMETEDGGEAEGEDSSRDREVGETGEDSGGMREDSGSREAVQVGEDSGGTRDGAASREEEMDVEEGKDDDQMNADEDSQVGGDEVGGNDPLGEQSREGLDDAAEESQDAAAEELQDNAAEELQDAAAEESQDAAAEESQVAAAEESQDEPCEAPEDTVGEANEKESEEPDELDNETPPMEDGSVDLLEPVCELGSDKEEEEEDKDVDMAENKGKDAEESGDKGEEGDTENVDDKAEDKSEEKDKDAGEGEEKDKDAVDDKEKDKDASKSETKAAAKAVEAEVVSLDDDDDIVCVDSPILSKPSGNKDDSEKVSKENDAVSSTEKNYDDGEKEAEEEKKDGTEEEEDYMDFDINPDALVPACEVQIIQENTSGRKPRQAAMKAESIIRKLAEEEEDEIRHLESDDKGDGSTEEKKVCHQCNKLKPCKYQILMHGLNRYMCSEECFSAFRSHRPIQTVPSVRSDLVSSSAAPTPTIISISASAVIDASASATDIPTVVVHSKEDRSKLVTHHITKKGERHCSYCTAIIKTTGQQLAWETMEFCHEGCLGKYQSILGSHCSNCKVQVKKACLGKYSVRFGNDIKQFCSSPCLEEFKRGLKVCSYCQKDISSSTDGFLAPVGDKGQFRDFCSKACMEKYETMNSPQTKVLVMHPCDVCNQNKAVRLEVMAGGKIHKLCSEPCFAAFKFVNKISAATCDMCHKYFDSSVADSHTVFNGGKVYGFCNKTCMNVYVLSNRKIVPCNWCKVKKYNFDMIERISDTGQILMLCSLNCLSLYQVSVNAASRSRIKCDHCSKFEPAQYHLTMSDATIRNFCSYSCVMNFQNRFTNLNSGFVQVPVPTGEPKRALSLTPRSGATGPENATGDAIPVISSVTSLASSGGPSSTAAPTPNGTVKPITLKAPLPGTQVVVSGASKDRATTMTTVGGAPGVKVKAKEYVLTRPIDPTSVRNKGTVCRAITKSLGVSCHPQQVEAETQTDEPEARPVLIPIPVPIYVPAPMHMYSSPLPTLIPFPLPIPVPVFIPTTCNGYRGVVSHIKEIVEKIPNNPEEAELLMMAELIANDEDSRGSGVDQNDCGVDIHDGGSNLSTGDSGSGGVFPAMSGDSGGGYGGDDIMEMALMAASIEETPADLEADLVGVTVGKAKGHDGQSNSNDLKNSFDPAEEEEEEDLLRETRQTRGKPGRKRSRATRGKGLKRAKIEPETQEVSQQSSTSSTEPKAVLKYTYGVQAWKLWVMQKNVELEKAAVASGHKVKLLKTDILQLTPDELNYSLCMFVKEVRKPNSEAFQPDSIHYLCLGIQKYLHENNRVDNIFLDSYYEKYKECLDEVVCRFPLASETEQGFVVTRIEEEHLWESKQLGVHSPQALLNTLLFFNTRYFGLRSVEDHMQLSFSHIMRHYQKFTSSGTSSPALGTTSNNTEERRIVLRFYPPTTLQDKDKKRTYEQFENKEQPIRCPVKHYEFYLSKCPESMKTRNDRFYLSPERSCVADSPVWYSTMPMSRESLQKMLNRFRTVKEINEAFLEGH